MPKTYAQKPFTNDNGKLKPLHRCNKFNIAHVRDQAEYLIQNFDRLLEITRKSVPGRKRNFIPKRKTFKPHKKSVERIMEHALYLKFKTPDSVSSESISRYLNHIPCYQFPLAAHGQKEKSKGWGKVDLIGCTPKRMPAVIELKKGESKETPLRVIVEGLAYAIALQEMWKQEGNRFRDEWSELFNELEREKIKVADLEEITVIGLAPSQYWNRWNVNEDKHSNLQKGTGAKIEELRKVAAESGFHIYLASYEADDDHRPISEIELITKQFCSNTHKLL